MRAMTNNKTTGGKETQNFGLPLKKTGNKIDENRRGFYTYENK